MRATAALQSKGRKEPGPRLARVTPGLSRPSLLVQLDEKKKRIIRILNEMNRHLDDPDYELPDCARAFYMSERSLQRVFEEQGTSFSEQLHHLRMRMARRLLLDSHLKIAEIARRVGYRHPSHFAKAYKRRWGITPREERKRAGMPSRLAPRRRMPA